MTANTGKLLATLKAQNQLPFRRLRQQILALMPEIVEASSAGYSLAAIWKTLKHDGRFHGGYNPFCRHVRQLMESSRPPSLQEKGIGKVSQQVQPEGVAQREGGTTTKPSFVWPNRKSRSELLGVE